MVLSRARVDLYSRRIIGSALSLTADAELVCRALRNALEIRPMMAACCFIQIKVFSIKAINTESYSAVMG